MDPTISVIVPVYKVEPYLRQCLDSIINQSYHNLEIIVIDDGSPDRCGEICDEYATRDKRIHVVHKKNEGLSAARNEGIRIATGEWIAFVDSDDWCKQDYYERFMKASKDSQQAEVICAGGFFLEYPNKSRKMCNCKRAYVVQERTEIEKLMAQITLYGLPWDKLYRSNFLKQNHLFYDTTSRAMEDFLFNYQVFDHAHCIAIYPIIGYYYRQAQTSISKGYNPQKPEINCAEICKMRDYAREQMLSPIAVQGVYGAAISSMAVSFNCYYFHPANTKSKEEINKEICQMIETPCYFEAIHNVSDQYLPVRHKVLKYCLRMERGGILRLLHFIKEKRQHFIS